MIGVHSARIFNLFIITISLLLIAPTSAESAVDDLVINKNSNRLNGRLISEFFNDYNYHSNNSKQNNLNDFARVKLDLNLRIFKEFSLNSTAKLEQMTQNSQKNNSNNSFFEDEGAFIEKLTLNYDNKHFAAAIGKFTVNFGEGWYFQDGIWNIDVARDNYRYNEKLGASATIKAGSTTTYGRYHFTLSSFANDNKYLDNSLITARTSSSRSDGQVGTVRGATSSYNISIDIDYDFNKKEKLSYHFAYLNLAAPLQENPIAHAKIKDQKSYILNIDYLYPWATNLASRTFLEYVVDDNLGGNKEKRAEFLTANLVFYFYQNWNLTFSHSSKNESEVAAAGKERVMNEISGGYKFGENSCLNGLQILLGVKNEKNQDVNNLTKDNDFGILLRYIRIF